MTVGGLQLFSYCRDDCCCCCCSSLLHVLQGFEDLLVFEDCMNDGHDNFGSSSLHSALLCLEILLTTNKPNRIIVQT